MIQAGETQTSKAQKNNSGSLGLIQERILIKLLDGNDISLKVVTPTGIADPRCLVK